MLWLLGHGASQNILLIQAPALAMTKVLVSDPIDQTGIEILSQVAEVDVRTGLAPEELKAIIGGYEGLMIRSGTQVTGEIIEAAIQRCVRAENLTSRINSRSFDE